MGRGGCRVFISSALAAAWPRAASKEEASEPNPAQHVPLDGYTQRTCCRVTGNGHFSSRDTASLHDSATASLYVPRPTHLCDPHATFARLCHAHVALAHHCHAHAGPSHHHSLPRLYPATHLPPHGRTSTPPHAVLASTQPHPTPGRLENNT